MKNIPLSELMTIEELKECAGFTVQVSLDGADAFADIELRNSDDGLPHLNCPSSIGDEPWGDVVPLPITEEVAAKMSPNGPRNIFSTIHLTKDIDGRIRYAGR